MFKNGYFGPITKITNGWVNATLAANFIGFLFEVVIILMIIGRLSPRDLGIKREKLLSGFLGTLLFWLTINIFEFLIALFSNIKLEFNNEIVSNPNMVFGTLFGQLFGNALLEEIVFRGFMFVQIYLLLTNIKKEKVRILGAVLLSQLIFAVIHIPNRIYSGLVGVEYVFDFIQLVIMGIIFSYIYFATKNLFFVIGIHSLINYQAMLWNTNFSKILILICFLILPFIIMMKRKKELSQSITHI
jgi:membrane protease YdiL (CAAX protease family)